MFIQEIIIDGFKSYAQKTVVSGFDPQFNAITGLNGSGKSNILDSICFVLGITNLSQVRVGNLQELVYKQGQAGVTKATVTIIFNNSDVSTSPIGYESHKQISVTRQVAIGGKNKYMINGHTVQQSQVQNFFHSVQLNVNNPHFLIMQGRITKVLNMKPEEILSMIEEAAGTRMFETKKQVSIKTMEKKQAKVDEITKCINDEITPTLENLRNERLDYHKFQKNQLEYDRLMRVAVAFDFHQHEEKLLHSEQHRLKFLGEIQEFQTQIELKNTEVAAANFEIEEIVNHRDHELALEMERLKKEESQLSKDVVKINTLVTNQQDLLCNEEENRKGISKNISTIDKSLKSKRLQFQSLEKEIEEKVSQSQQIEAEYLAKCEQYQNIFAGKTDENTTELLSYGEQLLTWEKCEREALSKLQTNEQKLMFSQKKLEDFNRKYASMKTSSSYDEIIQENENLRLSIKEKEKVLKEMALGEIHLEELNGLTTSLNNQLSTNLSRFESLQASLQARLNFEYTNPEKGFNREQRVKGFIANLFRMKDQRYAIGLEVIAGAKLREVVVDNEQTGKLLLERGNLKKRVTILPLNKLSSSRISTEKIQKAKEIAASMKGDAFSPFELISFASDVQKAIEYSFGNALLCSSADIAKTVAFHPEIKVKAVTIEGDCYDPAGTLTGGSSQTLGSLLVKIAEFREVSDKIEKLQRDLRSHKDNLMKFERANQQIQSLISEIEVLNHTLKMNEDKLSETDVAQIIAQRGEMEAEIKAITEERKQLHELIKKTKAELDKLVKMEKSAKSNKEQKLKEFEKQMKTLQTECNSVKNLLISIKSKHEALLTEIKSLEAEMQLLQDQKRLSDANISRIMQDKHDIDEKLTDVREQYERISSMLMQKNQELLMYSKEIQQLEKMKEEKMKLTQNYQLEIRKITHKLQQWEKEIKDSQRLIQSYLKEHNWINKEKQFFGQQNTDFDFQFRDMKQLRQKLEELKEEQERLSKKVNKKVMGMIETAENEYNELTRKREVILKDKAKIESVIEELDLKKIQSLQKTYDQVNRDFGSIFSMLLPGTSAKLEPTSDRSLMEGLEVKVAFNGVWKESLTELSGGQRSLLALSLILALLLFKPAPMYILDEVDAALDLSHTQNIGLMIRTHFSSSQFIVVSLKEGMFNNANVIFRTKFIDGVSTVSRTVSGARAKSQQFSSSTTTKENIENEINQVVSTAIQNKKSTISKKPSSKYKFANEIEDEYGEDEELEIVPARKRGKMNTVAEK